MDQPTDGAESLEHLALQVAELARSADEHILAAAATLREMRRRVEAGDAGEGVNWYQYAEAHIDLGKTRLRELLRIAEAEEPSKELERQRRMTQERVDRHREKNKEKGKEKSLEPERQYIIKWAREASIEQVRSIRKHLLDREGAKALHKPAGPNVAEIPEATEPTPANDGLPEAA